MSVEIWEQNEPQDRTRSHSSMLYNWLWWETKKCLRNQMGLKCSIIHKHFFFFFAFVLVPIPKYSATEICWRRCEKGLKKKSLLAFLEGVSAATPASEGLKARAGRLRSVWGCVWRGLGWGWGSGEAPSEPWIPEPSAVEAHPLQTPGC